MSVVHIIGGRVATVALAVLGAGAGIASMADHTPADAAPTAPAAVPAAQPIGTLTVVPELDVPTVLACRTEQGPADGAFRWESCVPDESPDGGPVDAIGEDGSASYSDGWSIAPVDESARGTVVGKWSEPAAPAAAPLRTVASVSPPRPVAGSCSEPAPVPAGGKPSSTPPSPAPQARPLVNVNTASVAQLDALPGIGDVLAARIVAQRPYASVADLHRVSRIPAKVFPLVTV